MSRLPYVYCVNVKIAVCVQVHDCPRLYVDQDFSHILARVSLLIKHFISCYLIYAGITLQSFQDFSGTKHFGVKTRTG